MPTMRRVPAALLPAFGLALALATGGAAPPRAEAGDKAPFALSLRALKEKVALGEEIPFEVTLKSGYRKAVPAAPLRLGAPSSVTFQVSVDGRVHQVARLLGRWENGSFKEDTIAYKSLKPGRSEKASLSILAIRPGKWKVSVFYRGYPGDVWPDPIQSDEVEVEVTPGAGGETRVGARIVTDKGTMLAELYPDDAFNTVHNFLTLARNGFFKDLVFHRLVKDFMIQGGCPKKDGTGNPGWFIPFEANTRKHLRGALSMARQPEKNSAGCQFFVMHAANPGLDSQYCVFGRLFEGDDVLETIATLPVEKAANGEMSKPLAVPRIVDIAMELLPPATKGK